MQASRSGGQLTSQAIISSRHVDANLASSLCIMYICSLASVLNKWLSSKTEQSSLSSQCTCLLQARLYIDGERFAADRHNPHVVDDWPLHLDKRVHFTKLVVGACWQGQFLHEILAVFLIVVTLPARKCITWWYGAVVTHWSRSTQLSYVGPG